MLIYLLRKKELKVQCWAGISAFSISRFYTLSDIFFTKIS